MSQAVIGWGKWCGNGSATAYIEGTILAFVWCNLRNTQENLIEDSRPLVSNSGPPECEDNPLPTELRSIG